MISYRLGITGIGTTPDHVITGTYPWHNAGIKVISVPA
jgi:hypothetical protein